MLQDLRFTFRLIAKEPWFTAAAILALSLGIGVNAVGFTIVNGAFFRGLPFEDSERLYVLSWLNRSGRRVDVSFPELQEWRTGNRAFAGLAAFSDLAMNVSDDRALPEHVRGTLVTVNTFGVLRQQPALGRDFTPEDDRRSAPPVVLIGDTLWKNRYGADPDVLGATLRVDGRPATIIGVMPSGVRFPDDTAIWAPFIPADSQEQRSVRPLTVFGRLRDEADRQQAQAEMTAVARQLAAAYPADYTELTGIRVETFTEAFVGGLGRTMFLYIMAAVTFVLLIACANVANLLLSRAAYRARELAVRMAVGATRARVVRQLLLESLVLATVGGGLGLLIALGGADLFTTALQSSGLPYWIRFTVDSGVFAYVATICIVTTVVFGLAPALHVSSASSHEALKEGARGATGSRRVGRLTSALIVTELALTLMLLGGGGLVVKSFAKLYSLDPGISADRLIAMNLRLPPAKYASSESRLAFFEELEARLSGIAGVESSAVTTGVPPSDGGERLLEVDPGGRALDARPRFVSTVTISPRFFEVVDRSILRGRGFVTADSTPGAEAAIVNERLAAQFFPGEDPIGRRIRFTARPGSQPPAAPEPWLTIVGISPPILHGSPQDAYVSAVVYLPYRQNAQEAASVLVRSAVRPTSILESLRREVQLIDADQPVFSIQTVEQLRAADRWPYRVFGSLFAILAGIALLLSSVGLYSVMAYAVTERRQEIGIRIAVGAQRRDISWLVLRRGLAQLAVGVPLGLAGALAIGVVFEGMLVDMAPGDPTTFAAVALLTTIVALAACLGPARWATRVDPMQTLRTH